MQKKNSQKWAKVANSRSKVANSDRICVLGCVRFFGFLRCLLLELKFISVFKSQRLCGSLMSDLLVVHRAFVS